MVEKIITLEEHFLAKGYGEYLDGISNQGVTEARSISVAHRSELEDIGSNRLRDMDAGGIDLQVISHTAVPLPPSLTAADAIRLARQANDQLAAAIAAHPNRFAGFANLPMTEPKAAAEELERAVKSLGMRGTMVFGTTRGRFLDDPSFFGILESAGALDVPIYIHPAPPPAAVREAYYSGFAPAVSAMFASAAWGWHQEVGLHVLRLVLAGVFDRLPSLRIIIGHQGESIPFMLDRIDDRLTPLTGHLEKPVRDYLLSNVFLTTSGFFSEHLLKLALDTFGADRILFSVDYPFARNEVGRQFLDKLSTVTPEEKEKIAHLNAEKVLNLTATP